MNTLEKFEDMLVYSLIADDNRSHVAERGFKSRNDILKSYPDRCFSHAITDDPLDLSRIFPQSFPELMNPVYKYLDKPLEYIMYGEDAFKGVVWCRFEKVPKVPKSIKVMGNARYAVICHMKNSVEESDTVKAYDKSVLVFDSNNNLVPYGFKGFHGLSRSPAHESLLCFAIGRLEDLNRTNSTKVTLSHNTKSIQFPLSNEIYKDEFITRLAPLTKTGRKRPILHSVCSHMRKNKHKIKQHERGIEEFYVDDIHVSLSLNQVNKALP